MGKFNEAAREQFLEALEETCSVKHAAARAGINRDTAYTHRKQDLAFAGRWDAAIERGLDDLLGEAYVRATTEKSDRLLEVLLKFRYGDQMADRLKVKVEDTGLDADALLRMPSEERKALTELLAKYKSNRREEDDDE